MRLRPPTLADLPAAFEVIEARQTADLGLVDLTLEDLRDEWQRSEVELGADARLVEDQTGSVVGYGLAGSPGALAKIKPGAEGNGAGALLLDWLEQRELRQRRSRHRQLVASANRSAAGLLGSRGYRLVRSYHRMARALAQLAPAEPPPGVELHPFAPSDTEAVHALDDRAFSGAADYEPESLTTFREEHLETHDAAPELSLTARDGERVVGFLLSRVRAAGTVGFVDVLAVDPHHQGRGIGRALLSEAFASFAAAGLKEAQLGVSLANDRAVSLYERAGMRPRFRHDVYEKPA